MLTQLCLKITFAEELISSYIVYMNCEHCLHEPSATSVFNNNNNNGYF